MHHFRFRRFNVSTSGLLHKRTRQSKRTTLFFCITKRDFELHHDRRRREWVGKQKSSGGAFLRSRNRQIKEHKEGACDRRRATMIWWRAMKNPTSATKKDSIVDTISAMEFCFIYGKCLYFALSPLFSVVLRAFFLISTINPPSSAPTRQKWRICIVQGFNRSRNEFTKKYCLVLKNVI